MDTTFTKIPLATSDCSVLVTVDDVKVGVDGCAKIVVHQV
jgi:hypothetical protein